MSLAGRLRKLILSPMMAVLLTAAAFASVASAASLGIDGADLWADSMPQGRCASSVVVTATSTPFNTVQIPGIHPACAGVVVRIALYGSGGVLLAEGSATVSANPQDVSLSATVNTPDVVGAAATLGGLGVPATTSLPPPTTTITDWYLINTVGGGATPTQWPNMPLVDAGTFTLPAGALPDYSDEVWWQLVPTPAGRYLAPSGTYASATWTTPAVTAAATLSGTATLGLEVQRLTPFGGRADVTATLQVVAPDTSVTVLGSDMQQTPAGNPWVSGYPSEPLTFSIPVSGALAAGDRLELVLTVANRTVRVQYGVAANAALLVLPAGLSV